MHKIRNIIAGLCGLVAASSFAALPACAATLTAGDALLEPGATGSVEVSGEINGESTFGYTILCELKPRPGALGIVTFTPAPPVDIEQVIDPWNGAGTFSKFDTDLTGSVLLNGAVNDDGQFSGNPLVFAGPLARFFVVASADASGLWDVLLSTSEGDSNWENVVTVLGTGLVTITAGACAIDSDCDDGNPCTDDSCNNNTCEHTGNTSPCDDGLFCTVVDVCTNGVCVGSGSPCGAQPVCDEVCRTCTTAVCEPPTATAEAGRFFAVTPTPGPSPVAILVKGMSPGNDCISKYVGADGRLQDVPLFQTPAQWSTIHVGGLDVIPETEYAVQADCNGTMSTCTQVRTFLWGDVNDSGIADLDDILLMLAGFSGNFDSTSPQALELIPCDTFFANITIDLDDILGVLAAFSGVDYGLICPVPCN